MGGSRKGKEEREVRGWKGGGKEKVKEGEEWQDRGSKGGSKGGRKGGRRKEERREKRHFLVTYSVTYCRA